MFCYSDIFPWEEFYERFVINNEEFTFSYQKKYIALSFGYKNGKLITALAYGNQTDGFKWYDFESPEDFLQAKIFNKKTLKEIWDELDN